jgi:hypothetical protein
MARPIKIVLIVLGVFLVIALVVPFFIDVDRYRPRIVAEVESRTGRKVEIGHIRARLLPTAGFSVEGVTVGAPAGFAPVNVLTVESVSGTVSLLALLHGEVEVSSVEIDTPHITLATDERGHTNYEFAPPARAKTAPSAPTSTGTALAIDSLSVRNAELRMVDVRGRNSQPPSVKISGVNLEFSSLDLSPSGIARWKGEIPLSGVKMELAGLPPVSFRSGAVKINKGTVTGHCEIDLPDSARMKGDFSVSEIEKLIATHAGGRSELLGAGKFTADKVRFAPYEVTNLTADLRAYNDHVDAPVTMALYGGTLSITPRLETAPSSGGARRFTAGVHLAQLDLERMAAADPDTRGKFTGHGEAKLQLAGALGPNLMNSLTGQGSFVLRDGRISGLKAAKSFEALSAVGKVLAPGLTHGGDLLEAAYTFVQGDLSVHGGRMHTTNMEAQTNRGRGNAHGSMGFDQTLDLSGTWVLAKGSGSSQQQSRNPIREVGGLFGKAAKHTVGEFPIPFMVKGTLQHPLILPGG